MEQLIDETMIRMGKKKRKFVKEVVMSEEIMGAVNGRGKKRGSCWLAAAAVTDFCSSDPRMYTSTSVRRALSKAK